MKRNPKSIISVVAASSLLFGMTAPVFAERQAEEKVETSSAHYSDVPKSSSHYGNIHRAGDLGLMTGYGDGTFKPGRELSRGNVVKALGKYAVKQSELSLDQYMKTYSISRVESFRDVPDNAPDQELVTYSKIVKDLGIFTGSDNRLMAGKPIRRDQMAEVLVRTFALKDLPGKPGMKDTGKSAYAKSIEILFENGITNANPYRPDSATSRAQMASLLVRAYEKVSKEKSVMPADFYSLLRQGKVKGAAVQAGSNFKALKEKLGEPEGSWDFEGGLRHIYGRYEYGVPYDEPKEPITTVTYNFNEGPTAEEILRYMGYTSSEFVDGEEQAYWYKKGEYEIFFNYTKGQNKMDSVTVKWNGYY